MEHGGIYTVGNATGTATAINTGIDNASWTKLTGFDALFPANGVVVNHGVDELTVQGEGVYEVDFNATFWGEASQVYAFGVLENDVIRSDIRAETPTVATQTFVSVAMSGLVEVDANERYAIGVQIDDAGPGTITLRHAQFTMKRVS